MKAFCAIGLLPWIIYIVMRLLEIAELAHANQFVNVALLFAYFLWPIAFILTGLFFAAHQQSRLITKTDDTKETH